MKVTRFPHISQIAPVAFLAFLAWFQPDPAAAYLPPGEPTYFAGNPWTRQLAFRYRVGLKVLGWTQDNTGIYGLFSQSSLWYLDNQDRGYTVENSFEPEVQFFADGNILTKAANWWPRKLNFSVSYSHHSNGNNGSLSRSWNHINGGLYWGDPSLDPLTGSVIGWYPFNVESSNPDIDSYAGQGRITLYLRPPEPLKFIGRTQLFLASHFSFDTPGDSFFTNLEVSLGFAPFWLSRPPFPGPDPSKESHEPETDFGLFIQWVVGRGESLIDYQQYQNTLRFGIQLW